MIGWLLFLWAWISIMRFTAPETIVVTTILLAAIAIAIAAIDLTWIWHNLNIYKRKGYRKNVPQVPQEFRQDFLGRQQAADWQNLRGETLIVVSFDEEQKTFAPYRQEPTVEKLANYSRLRGLPTPPEGEEEAV